VAETLGSTWRRQLARAAILVVVLAPVVTVVLMGLSRLQRDTPEWAYWQAELIFLIVFDVVYQVAWAISLAGAMAFGFLFTNRRGGRASRPVIARGLVLSIALLGSLSAGEMLVAAWIAIMKTLRFNSLLRRDKSIFAPTFPTGPGTDKSIWS
jgi:hypothetical protein